jgi:hypothetical protein
MTDAIMLSIVLVSKLVANGLSRPAAQHGRMDLYYYKQMLGETMWVEESCRMVLHKFNLR